MTTVLAYPCFNSGIAHCTTVIEIKSILPVSITNNCCTLPHTWNERKICPWIRSIAEGHMMGWWRAVTWLGIVSFTVSTNWLGVPDFTIVETLSGNDMWTENDASHRHNIFPIHQSCRLVDLNQIYCYEWICGESWNDRRDTEARLLGKIFEVDSVRLFLCWCCSHTSRTH